MSHTSLFVTDQNKAFDFYVNKLGFRVNTDVTMENGFRWLTLNPPEQPDLEISILLPLHDGMHYDQETRNAFKTLLEKEALGAGVLYTLIAALRMKSSKQKEFNLKASRRKCKLN